MTRNHRTVISFKYLGMVCARHINLNTAADAALSQHDVHSQVLLSRQA